MLSDIVIDTNVLSHSSNPVEERFADSSMFLEMLAESSLCICVDEGFEFNESTNRSLIGAEYLLHVVPGSLAAAVLTTLLNSGRVREVARLAPQALQRRINQMVRNRRDRTFLAVAVNSIEHVLVSHDYEDFQQRKRADIRRRIGVSVIEASAAHQLVAP